MIRVTTMQSPALRQLRVGAVSYLNTKPLVYGLDRLSPRIELDFDLPSRLADRLAAGQLDVALIPSIEYFQNPGYSLVSDACIACRGPVWSVKLLSRVALSEIRTLALDEGSRTSVALVRILLKQRFDLEPQTIPLPLGAELSSVDVDGVLLIGDRAMHVSRGDFRAVWDLGEEWCRWAELPFVFAMWVARGGGDVGDLAAILEQARDAGVRSLPEIARREAPALGLSVDACLGYLRDNLHFSLGPLERLGLERFREHAARIGLVPSPLSIETSPSAHVSGKRSAARQTT
jgi:chorismate dehydratase